MKHIRKTDTNVKDQRFRTKVKYANTLRPTFCGAEPTENDFSRANARHILKHAHPLVPSFWAALSEMCPDCKRLLPLEKKF